MKIIFALITSILLVSCFSKNNYKKVAFATVGYPPRSPYIAIEIYDELSYKYYKGKYATNPGFYVGKISKSKWQELTKILNNLDPKILDEHSNFDCMEISSELILTTSNGMKHINWGHLEREELIPLENWFINSYKFASIRQVHDSIPFSTEYQYPPKEKTNHVKFPAPK